MTSRSRSYYVSAAYWARDACLWSFPGLLLVDPRQARRALQVMLTRYLPNAAQHALYLNGQTPLPRLRAGPGLRPADRPRALPAGHRQPGIAPAALAASRPQPGLSRRLSEHFDPQVGLYSTFLTPHDDPTGYPFITYNNVLVWRALNILADLDDIGATHYRNASHLKRASHLKSASHLRQQAEKLKQTIQEKCVREGPYGPQYVAAVDAAGDCDWNDLPGGSWSLFPYYGFCSADDPLYLNSLQWIYSEHNPHYYPGPFGGAGAAHFPFPSCFDLANRLLRKDPAALQIAQAAQTGPGAGVRVVRPADGRGAHRRGLCYAGGFFGVCNLRSWRS